MFVDEWFDQGFYKELPLSCRSQFTFGQFFWTHAYYPHENLELWRPVPEPDEQTKSYASKFQQESAGKDAFKRSIPLHSPKLETNEEFIVIRAKIRPVLLIQPELPIPASESQGYRGKVHRRRCTIAQVYGLSDPKTCKTEFSPTFVDKVRKMEYPQLMFLPKNPGLFQVDSLLRFDELQSVFSPHLDPTAFSLGDEVIPILRDQIQFLLAGLGPNQFTLLREELLKS